MKALKFIILLMAGLTAALALKAQTGTSQLKVPLSSPGKPYTLNVGLMSGNIDIAAYDGNEILIDFTGDDAKRTQRAYTGSMRVIGGGSTSVTAIEKDNKVTINGDASARRGNVKIKVPRGTNTFKLTTVNSNGILATDIGGEIEVSNTNGDIKLTNVAGSVVANTTNGNVVVSFKSVDAKSPMAFTTLNGKVDITVPAAIKANIKLHTDRGEIFSDFDVAVEASTPTTTRGKDGSYRYTEQEWVTGKLNGGGPEFTMRTFNGNIFIRKAK
ncbi:DUF4097 domain-containing protein [Mucilaginibacter calamicampi]|uniref:DUF4097 domain-containing protein n=1 Tax=Mucilaginibacter calamicampi TaxID=1302352 RepID=A0ABW2YXN8_9SPHI